MIDTSKCYLEDLYEHKTESSYFFTYPLKEGISELGESYDLGSPNRKLVASCIRMDIFNEGPKDACLSLALTFEDDDGSEYDDFFEDLTLGVNYSTETVAELLKIAKEGIK